MRRLDATGDEPTAVAAATGLTRLAETPVGHGAAARACHDDGAVPFLRAIARFPRTALALMKIVYDVPAAARTAVDAGGVRVLVGALRCPDTGEESVAGLAGARTRVVWGRRP